MSLSENDYEKIGVKYLGDIKKLIFIFSEKELIKNYQTYQNIENKNIIIFKNEEKIIKEMKPIEHFIRCDKCGEMINVKIDKCQKCGYIWNNKIE